MYFSNKTIYDRKRLIRFSDFCVLKKKFLWVAMIICSAVVLITELPSLITDPHDTFSKIYLIVVLALFILLLFLLFIAPRIGIKKSPAYEAQHSYEFEDEVFKIDSTLKNGKDSLELKYSSLVKVMESRDDVYLFISNRQAYVLDKSGFTAGNPEDFVIFIQSKGIPLKR